MAIWSVEYSTSQFGVGPAPGLHPGYGDVKLRLMFDSDGSGKHKINYELRYQKRNYNQMTIGEVRIVFGSKEVYYRSPDKAQKYNDGDLICSGKFDYTGTGNVRISFQAGIYVHAINTTGSTTLSLAINPKLITVSVTGGNAVVGERVSIHLDNFTSLTNPSSGVTTDRTSATVRYKVGNLEGTIVEKHEKTWYDWDVPTLFYTYYPDVTSTAAILYCDTYDFAGTTLLGTTQYNFTLYFVDGPDLEPTVRDVDPITTALTGADNKFIRFFSDVEYSFNATPGDGTYLSTATITCGNKSNTITSAYDKELTGVIKDIEEAKFVFTVTDGRWYSKTVTLNRTLIEYKKLTCNIWRKSATADGTIEVGLKGDYWAHNFGVKHNTLKLSYRYKAGSGEFSDWVSFDYLTDTDDYEATITLRDLDYQTTYTFEAMAQDELMTVVSRQLPVHCLPIYDWGRDDFNLNVVLNMNNETILRHNHQANNLVVSSSGGFIYFRPKGTDDTSAEIKFTPQGNIELSGDIIINGKSLKSLLKI
jgi:hypothetical protein